MALTHKMVMLCSLVLVVLGADCQDPSTCSASQDETSLLQVKQQVELSSMRVHRHIASLQPEKCEDDDATAATDCKGSPDCSAHMKSVGIEIKGCSSLQSAGVCATPIEKASTWTGLVCPKSCGWCSCTDDNKQFTKDAPQEEVDKLKADRATESNFCEEAAKKGWCDQAYPCKAKAGTESPCAEEEAAFAKEAESWMWWACRKSCCNHHLGSHGAEGHASCKICSADHGSGHKENAKKK